MPKKKEKEKKRQNTCEHWHLDMGGTDACPACMHLIPETLHTPPSPSLSLSSSGLAAMKQPAQKNTELRGLNKRLSAQHSAAFIFTSYCKFVNEQSFYENKW